MADTILVIAEQREGKLNRVSLETVAAAQAIAAETGATVEAALFGSGIAGIVQEIAAKKLAKVTVIESPKLAMYGRAERFHQPEEAHAGADAAHLPGARLCSATGNGLATHAHQ
jgi:electron transfer flavoprotein alpha subunit